MKYIYDSVLKAMGGKYLESPLKEGQTLKGWSPNQYKRLIIMQDGVLVETFLGNGGGKLFRFNPEGVSADLSSPNQYRNPLAALFDHKSFSCIEEVVVDRALVTDGMLNSYLTKITDTHRLRAIGVSEQPIQIDLIQLELKKLNETKKNEGFLISEQLGLSYKKLPNYDDYWKKFLLRPQLYEPDSDTGHLKRYFEAVRNHIQTKSNKSDLLARAKDMIAYDSKDISFWNTILKYLKAERPQEEATLINTLKQILIATPNSYIEGLKPFYAQNKKDDMYPIYGSFGYFSTQGSENRRLNQKGYLPSRESVGERSYKELGILFNKNHSNLQSLKITKNASKADILESSINFLLRGMGEMLDLVNDIGADTEAEEMSESTDEIEVRFLSFHERNRLLKLLPYLSDQFPFATKCYLEEVSDGISISRDDLNHTNLNEQSITLLEMLGCIGQGKSEKKSVQKQLSLINERLLVFLDKICHLTTDNLRENSEKKWLTVDTVEYKLSYVKAVGVL